MSVLNRFQSFIKEHALFGMTERVLLAVSGGRDSVLMAHLFQEAGIKFGIAHCNFMLRGSESMEDEQFCSDLAEQFEVPFYSSSFDTTAYAEENHISIQMAARDLRYEWLEKIRADFTYQVIGLAHHQNDTIETLILNLTRGTGIAGLHGIAPKRNKFVRPLLFLNRSEIDLILEERGYPYREDSSNYSVKYARNKIRNLVIPALKELNPSLEATFEANRRRFAELEMILDQRVQELREELFKEDESGQISIPLNSLQKLSPINTLLFGLLQPYGFTESLIRDLIHSWHGNPGKIFSSANYDVLLDRNKLLLSKRNTHPAENTIVNEFESEVNWNNFRFRFRKTDHAGYEIIKTNDLAQLDFDKLDFPLTIRSWQEGDAIHPIGLEGKQKISDLFIGSKIPLNQKKKVPVLVNGNGDILWVGGLRIDKRFIISSGTKKVFIFEQYI